MGSIDVGIEVVSTVDAADHRVRRKATHNNEEYGAKHRRDAKFSTSCLYLHTTCRYQDVQNVIHLVIYHVQPHWQIIQLL